MTDDTAAASAKRAVTFWIFAFVGAMFGTALLLRTTAIVPAPWGMAVLIAPMLLLIPLVRAAEAMQRQTGCDSAAAVRYNRRILFASFLYVAGLAAALILFKGQDVSKPVAALLSLLPTLPVFGIIWAMGRYIVEESDEYLRARTVSAALVATGLLLAVATFWGFLTTFEVVPNVPMWAAVPVWCFGLGIGQLVNKVRGA
ncbi:hypothetical protein [Sphingopyxis sp. PET50]|uniref:hypothetical protein n=1 Tax=Sphingopyxis sp. PET50 TaxID=2976533 RepID=UPI0021AF4EEB|nr:hypothetical protein [Sphingopyxis sp. PET50]